MTMLLSRVADNVYWGGRYLERAEDTARIVRSYTELIIDLPVRATSSWEPLLALVGNRGDDTHKAVRLNELDIVRYLVTDDANPGSILTSIGRARENLRTTREVLPREAWQAVNDLHLFVGANASTGVERRTRSRFLGRVITESQTLDGIMYTSMSRDEAYDLWRLGQTIERADMTTRVVGVRAASLLGGAGASGTYEDVQWMGVLRSVSALQMFQRKTRGPIEGPAVVSFLLFDPKFPRSVASCIARMREALTLLPKSELTLASVTELEAVMSGLPTRADDGEELDDAMDRLQAALADVHDAVSTALLRADS
jgi:uncharacterized alpha-E superfamily protein